MIKLRLAIGAVLMASLVVQGRAFCPGGPCAKIQVRHSCCDLSAKESRKHCPERQKTMDHQAAFCCGAGQAAVLFSFSSEAKPKSFIVLTAAAGSVVFASAGITKTHAIVLESQTGPPQYESNLHLTRAPPSIA